MNLSTKFGKEIREKKSPGTNGFLMMPFHFVAGPQNVLTVILK